MAKIPPPFLKKNGEPSVTKHGSVRGYEFFGCRCLPCRVAAANYRKLMYVPIKTIRPFKHGTPYGYKRKGCRCDPCRKRNSDDMKAYWKRRKEAEK